MPKEQVAIDSTHPFGCVVDECLALGSSLAEARSTDLKRPSEGTGHFRGVLQDRQGHFFILLGAFAVDGGVVYQLAHGPSEVSLASSSRINETDFPRAWSLRAQTGGVRIRVGKAILLARELHYNFGEFKPSEKLGHDFKFINVGDRPIVIERPETSCSCTATSAQTDTVISPGEDMSLAVTVRSANKATVSEYVLLNIQDPEHVASRRIRLTLLGSQRIFRSVSHGVLEFGALRRTQSRACTVTVAETPDDRYTVTSVDVGPLPLRWTISRSRNAEGMRLCRIRFELTTQGEAHPGKQVGVVRIGTDGKDPKDIPIPVRFEVSPEVACSPTAVAVGEACIGAPCRQVVRLSSLEGRPIRVVLKRVPPEVSIRVADDGREINLHIQITLQRPGAWHDVLEIEASTRNYTDLIAIDCAGIGLKRE